MHDLPPGAPGNGSGHGLATAEAASRRARTGPNLLPQDAPRRWPAILLEVLREPMLLLLFAAGVVYLLLGDVGEAIALLGSIVAVAGLAFSQSLRSEHALQALRELGSPRARVLRDGRAQVIPGIDVVVGDLLLLEEGDRVAADALLQSAQDLLPSASATIRPIGTPPRGIASTSGDRPRYAESASASWSGIRAVPERKIRHASPLLRPAGARVPVSRSAAETPRTSA